MIGQGTAVRHRKGVAVPIHILQGPPRSGKTTALRRLLARSRARQLRVGGFLALGRWTDGRRAGFDLEPCAGGAVVPLCRAETPPDGPAEVALDEPRGPRVGRFRFTRAGLRAGRRALEAAAADPPDLAVVDEIGFLELEGGGWDPWLRPLLAAGVPLLLVVRDELVERVCEAYGIDDPIRHRPDEPGWPESVLDTLEEAR